jgi:tyrosyl-tRNA synthetase
MEAKIALGKSIVADYHPAAEAERAAAVFDSVVRRKQAPDEIESVALPPEVMKDGAIRVDKLLARIGLAESVSDAVRKLKAGAVEINGAKWTALAWTDPAAGLLIQVGKNWRKVIR